MEQKIFKNRRGEDMIVDFWAILIFAIIVILFFILFSIKASDKSATEAKFDNRDANFMLQAFLRAPAVDYDTDKTVADIIVEDYAKKDYTHTRYLFDKFFRKVDQINGKEVNDILINIEGKRIKMINEGGVGGFGKAFLLLGGGGRFEKNNAYTIMPGYDGTIRVSLRISGTVVTGESNTPAETPETENGGIKFDLTGVGPLAN